ncbi:hypothetical protein Tel_05205 [Candidatus Tenderia electrophaga]|jgi:hypothetical protein|uniref:Motility protein n=1 Tax=Candidatus Tenderia electrophaga TaxID=1748243 RepID=A0A0S2TBQ2_9GAMM|nr:hypothetical protein Tel_05205 [Candidatus Tenderia electrophaga]
MDISGVMTPAASQVAKQKAGDPVGVAVLNKAMDIEKDAAAELIKSVVNQSQEVPTEKLPSHLGRNIDVTA